MAQEPVKIKEHIDAERERLGHDLDEIEHRVRDAFDWRSWYESNTVAMLGAAAAGGLVVSMLVDRKSGERHREEEDRYITSAGMGVQPMHSRVRSPQLSRIGEVIENTFAALLGVGAARFQDYVSEMIPGFREKYQEVERKHSIG